MHFITSFIILVPFWFLMSGKFDMFHIALGIISLLIVSIWSGKLLIQSSKKSFITRLSEIIKFIPYIGWLLIEIIKSNIHIIAVSLSPNIHTKINPQIITFKTKLKHDISKFILANSITLTPGTVTIRVSKDKFMVHALTDKVAVGVPGDMEKKVAMIFNERISS
ncbi:cation transporter [bacterium]|nr:cation transporter [bacterium]